MRAARLAQASHHRIVLAEIAREIDDRDRNARLGLKPAAFLEAAVGAAIIDEHDFMPARNLERFERLDELADACGAVIDRDDDAQGQAHGLTAVARIDPPKGKRKPCAPSQASSARAARNKASTGIGRSATSLASVLRMRRCATMRGKSRLFQ